MKEFQFKGVSVSGFIMIFVQIAMLAAIGIIAPSAMCVPAKVSLAVVLFILFAFCFAGYFQMEPNEARVMVFFGKYRGTFARTGFHWVNPFYTRKKVSLRARNLDVEPIKVNDKVGNPIMVGLVLVWKLKDTYRAMFDIDSQTMAGAGAQVSSVMKALENFVHIQSDAALRQVAAVYNYDDNDGDHNEITLRSGGEEVNEVLERTLNERLEMAGIEVVEARINYLAYAPEIAAVMLRRQQASAVISAREKIVEGAVSMVKMALDRLSDEEIVKLDEERKAAMVSNLLVVLCADEAAQPVVNTGSLYQ